MPAPTDQSSLGFGASGTALGGGAGGDHGIAGGRGAAGSGGVGVGGAGGGGELGAGRRLVPAGFSAAGWLTPGRLVSALGNRAEPVGGGASGADCAAAGSARSASQTGIMANPRIGVATGCLPGVTAHNGWYTGWEGRRPLPSVRGKRPGGPLQEPITSPVYTALLGTLPCSPNRGWFCSGWCRMN